jgi:hypothetical protein
MGLSTTRDPTSSVTSRQFPSTSLNPKVYYRIRKLTPLVSILIQTNPVHTTPSYLYKSHLNVI